jgi:glycerol uptake facilitator-like aquaporin
VIDPLWTLVLLLLLRGSVDVWSLLPLLAAQALGALAAGYLVEDLPASIRSRP